LLTLEQHSNQSIRFEDLKFTVYVKFRLTTRVRCFYISVIQLSFPSDFRDYFWVGLDIGVGIWFLDRNVVPGSTKYVDPGTSLTWQNQDVRLSSLNDGEIRSLCGP